ncbi:MAG: hypothetical protein NWT08_14015 [Akkermansiaceae bacterium]|jgi:hypothetical protein|nr:hypothetical protein [Akkermansiaceae bacterium]MDP4647137.1 hypothetical protein [Akkermansiaceae bacterium]MDP4722607.1 hypothetical protein [Akkermansiaceae bacterium]MDP4780431.1 hypothetical protein [Akkermansiaceae bacterium]MDP4897288.1 hypothetical protein [Akkermansiaceae bacterium]
MKTIFAIILLTAVQSGAAVVNFTITLGDIVPAGQGLTQWQDIDASVSYNESLVPLIGSKTLKPSEDSTITVNLNFAGFTYTQADDLDYPDFPELYFEDGEIHGISYFAENKSNSAGYLLIEGDNQLFTYSFDGFTEYFGEVMWPVDIEVIPEPSYSLICILTLTAYFLKRRRPHT